MVKNERFLLNRDYRGYVDVLPERAILHCSHNWNWCGNLLRIQSKKKAGMVYSVLFSVEIKLTRIID